MNLELQGKRALVTGASKGIGKAIALELAREGAIVTMASRDEVSLTAAAAEIAGATGARVLAIPADTANDQSVESLVAAVVAELDGIDILVNAAARPAGQAPAPKLADITQDLFFEEMNTKVLGYLRCIRAVAPHMVKQRWGRIINIGGLAARQTGSALWSMRNVSVAAMTKNIAEELGPFGVNVTVVHPGLTRTEAVTRIVNERAEATGRSVAEIERELSGGAVIARGVGTDEVAWVVAFLASPKSVAIAGDAIAVGGGALRAIHY